MENGFYIQCDSIAPLQTLALEDLISWRNVHINVGPIILYSEVITLLKLHNYLFMIFLMIIY